MQILRRGLLAGILASLVLAMFDFVIGGATSIQWQGHHGSR
jgi:hypothetical protein